MKHTITDVDYEPRTEMLTYFADGKHIEVWGDFETNKDGNHCHTHIFSDGEERTLTF